MSGSNTTVPAAMLLVQGNAAKRKEPDKLMITGDLPGDSNSAKAPMPFVRSVELNMMMTLPRVCS